MTDSLAPIAPNNQAQREAQMARDKQIRDRLEAREKEMAQRRASRPSDKNMPDGIEELIVGDGVQQYKRMRDVERRLDVMMMRKRLDLQDTPQRSKEYKRMRIWVSNTVDFQSWQGKGEDQEMYDFSGSSEGIYRMKIEGRLLDDGDDGLLGDDESDEERDDMPGRAGDHTVRATPNPTIPVNRRSKTKLSHFFKAITVELDRNKNLQADYTTQIEWKRPHFPKDAMIYPHSADFDSLEFERKGDQDINCTIHFYRDDDRWLLSDTLAELLDTKEADQISILNALWDYIKAMNLQQDDEKRAVQCDDRLRKVSPAEFPLVNASKASQFPRYKIQHYREKIKTKNETTNFTKTILSIRSSTATSSSSPTSSPSSTISRVMAC